ncbi:MAG TPA: hypothetical protein VHF23_01415 [Gaiellaceae bacterium]|nr:hypothetical protein [Gaiellaceae bacterium]
MRRACIAVILGAMLVVVGPAAAQVPLPDVDETVDDVVETVEGTVEETVDTVNSTAGQVGSSVEDTSGGVTGSSGTSGGTSGGTLSGTTDAVLGTGGTSSSGGQTSASGDGSSARAGSGSPGAKATEPGRRYRSAFDRLPQRLERLLERIALGRNVRANLERLERLLASASPELRARVLRLLRAEIRRLRADGVTRAERASIERLQLVRRTLTDAAAAAAAGSSSSGSAWTTGTGYEAPYAPASFRAAGEALGTAARSKTGGGEVLGAKAGPSDGDGELGGLPIPLPDPVEDFPLWLGLLLLAFLGVAFAGIVAGATRRVLERTRSG